MSVTHLQGDCREVLRTLPERSVHCCVTSPPYWGLRDYGVAGQLGMEDTPEEYIANMVDVFREVWRVLRDDGTLWLNIGDSYSNDGKYGGETGGKQSYLDDANRKRVGREKRITGLKPKDLVGIPWMLAFALRADGWYLRQEIIWHKPNPMPESADDRCTKAHEQIFLFTKRPRYFFDAAAIAEPATCRDAGNSDAGKYAGEIDGEHRTKANKHLIGARETRNKRTVWTVPTKSYKGAHFAVFPPKLIEPCILAGTSAEGCCDQCGAPYVRITEKERVPTRTGTKSKVHGVSGLSEDKRHVSRVVTKGWRQTCKCEHAKPVPCTVLDPFGGSGTTGQVAERCGCHAILIELNEAYIKLQRKRVEQRCLHG